MRVMVIKEKRFNTVHIRDNDGRESVFRQSEIKNLIMILRKAARAKGIPREEFDEGGVSCFIGLESHYV